MAGFTDAEIELLQDRVARLQARVDRLGTTETTAQRRAVRARDRLAAADQAAVQAAERVARADEAVAAAEDDLAEARADVEAAQHVALLASDALDDADAALHEAERTMQLRVRSAWMDGGHVGLASLILGVEDVNLVARINHLVSSAVDEDHDTIDRLLVARAVRQDQAAMAAATEVAAGAVAERVGEAERTAAQRRDDADAAAVAAERATSRLQRRVERLGDQAGAVSTRRLRLEQRLAAAQAELETALDGGGGLELETVWADRGDGVLIGGLTVNHIIAGQVQALLAAAAQDGVVLGGSGYRTPETTVRLRKANGCPDIYQSPASSCRVPTAIPGRSMHERGLAIDFAYQGSTLCFPSGPSACHGNPGFDWLVANADRFGLEVNSAEAWHWSIDGS